MDPSLSVPAESSKSSAGTFQNFLVPPGPKKCGFPERKWQKVSQVKKNISVFESVTFFPENELLGELKWQKVTKGDVCHCHTPKSETTSWEEIRIGLTLTQDVRNFPLQEQTPARHAQIEVTCSLVRWEFRQCVEIVAPKGPPRGSSPV